MICGMNDNFPILADPEAVLAALRRHMAADAEAAAQAAEPRRRRRSARAVAAWHAEKRGDAL